MFFVSLIREPSGRNAKRSAHFPISMLVSSETLLSRTAARRNRTARVLSVEDKVKDEVLFVCFDLIFADFPSLKVVGQSS